MDTNMATGIRGVQIRVGRLDGEPASPRHSVPGVGDEVHEDLLDLARVGGHVSEPRIPGNHQGDILPDQPPQHLIHVRDDGIEVQHLRLEHLLPAEGEELAGEIGRPLRRLLHEFEIRARRVLGIQAPQQQLDAPNHDREEVIEIVGHAAGEAPDGLELSGLGELVLGLRECLIGPLGLVIEPAVLEGDRRLGGERRGDREILRGEAQRPPAPNAQDPEHLLAEDERHPKEGRVPAAPVGFPMRRRHPVVGRRVPNEERLTGGRDNPGEALTHLQARRGHGLARVAVRAREHEVLPLPDTNPHRVRIQELPARFGNLREQ